MHRGREPCLRPHPHHSSTSALLAADPIAERRVDQLFERLAAFAIWARQLVVIHKRVKSIFATVPDVPDKRAAMEERAVFFEEFVAQPIFERIAVTD